MTIHVLIYGCSHCEEWRIEEVFGDEVDALNSCHDKTEANDKECAGGYYTVESWEVH